MDKTDSHINAQLRQYDSLVRKIAARYYVSKKIPTLEFDDYYLFGQIGLWKAIVQYDNTRVKKFMTYASMMIEWYIKSEIQKIHHVWSTELKLMNDGKLSQKRIDGIKRKLGINFAAPINIDPNRTFAPIKTPEQIYLEKEELNYKLNRIRRLPQQERMIVQNMIWDKKSNREIGDLIGVSNQAINKQKKRAKYKLTRSRPY